MNGVFQMLGTEGFGAYAVSGWPESASLRRLDESAEHLLVPGFVDSHIHGANGIDFMSASTDQLLELCSYLADQGYEGFLPTTVTAGVGAVLDAVGRLPDHPMILGFHLEGPFISPAFPGAQPRDFILEPPTGSSEWDAVFDSPGLKVVTLAPELPWALLLIERLAGRAIRVGFGHTNAGYAEAKAGFQAGASHATHTFNAMRPFHHREAGIVGFALTEPGFACELIYDRLHVCREAADLLIRSKPSDKVIGISDGTMAAGLPVGSDVTMWGQPATVGAGDVRLADGTLAGSAVTLRQVFRNLLQDFGAEVAIRACCLNPRHLLGMTDAPRVWLEMSLDGELLAIHRP